MINDLLKISIFGESHQKYIGATIENLAPGIKLDLDFIRFQLKKRQGEGTISTKRIETDEFKIISGFYNGFTTGTPLTVIIENQNIDSRAYLDNQALLRPSHADYSALGKYQGFNDPRGGGFASGRLTAPLVVIGAIAIQVLKAKGIYIASHLLKLKDIEDDYFPLDNQTAIDLALRLNQDAMPVINHEAKEKMINTIVDAKKNEDSVGAIIESVIINPLYGIGEPFFNSLESKLSSLLFSIPGIKGVEFGLGFDFANYFGSEVNDEYYFDQAIKTKTNNNGGILGGISTGAIINVKSVVKPTSSIGKVQRTVNYQTNEETTIKINGRHDPSIASRIAVVIDSVIAIGYLEQVCLRYGYMWMGE